MKTCREIHTTLDVDSYNYLKNMQKKHNVNLNTVIKILIDRNKECEKKLEKKIFQEVVNHVVELYIHSEYYSKN